MSTDEFAPTGGVPESSGTAATHDPTPVPELSPDSTSLSSPLNEEQALESHEVIELQTFSERKAWIEDKIKFLEKMPPIEVFVSLDAIRVSAEEVPGLPTRAELQQWVAEHDIIEKETEVFDTGELTKLRQLTKAATQRNLSPEDTDVIELTLTTIYELDKLLHLLRDRSENLELLRVRLTWEEYRISAWADRRKILEDLEAFLETRARWTPSVYDSPPRQEDTSDMKRRGSVASFASANSESSVSSPGLSRSARFKLAELLSRDAAQFAGRVTSLRHGKVSAAGKVLDKLIDSSQKPVPEVLLDEQDKLEEKGIAEMENIGKFVMSIVMQWRKADEIYVETIKDQTAAQNLLEEIETAKLHHPTARQSNSFISRADALIKRLSLRGNPASSSSTFPCPEHPLFSEQKASNKSLAKSLSSEISAGMELARKVNMFAKEYRATYEAVKRVETLTQAAGDLSRIFLSIIERLEKGVSARDGDGSPPNLMSESCLEPTNHSVFLALLPSVLDEKSHAAESANQLLRGSRAALAGLDVSGIDPSFRDKAVSEVQRLTSLLGQAQTLCIDMKARVDRLREARRLWTVMAGERRELVDVRHRQLAEAMERHKWRQASGRSGTPLTPESPPSASLVVDPPLHSDVVEDLNQFGAKLIRDIDTPLAHLSRTLETPLIQWLARHAQDLKGLLETVKQMARLLKLVQHQATVMKTVCDEFNELQIRIEDAKMRIDLCMDEILSEKLAHGCIAEAEVDIGSEMKAIQYEVKTFIDSLAMRIPFVAQHCVPSRDNVSVVKRRFTPGNFEFGGTHVTLPLDLSALDDVVRADSNSYAMRLSGSLEGLARTTAHLHLAGMAKEVDSILSATVKDIVQVRQELSGCRTSLLSIVSQSNISQRLATFLDDVEETTMVHRRRIGRSFSPIRELLRRMDAASGVHDASVHEVLYVSRNRAVDDAELRFKTWDQDVAVLKEEISHARWVEAQKLEEIRLEEEHRQQAERDCLAAEEAERARMEQERSENEERQRLETECLAEERRQEAERKRIAAEEAERERLERERLEAEEKQRLKEARLVEEKRIQAEEAEKATLYRERLEVEEKLKLVEQRLAEELQLKAQNDRIAAHNAEQNRLEAEEEENIHVEQERLTEQRRVQTETDQKVAKEAERRHLEQEPINPEYRASAAGILTPDTPDEDVFGLRLMPSEARPKHGLGELQAQIYSLRKRLRSISINEVSRPTKASARLPDWKQLEKMTQEFSNIVLEVSQLPSSSRDASLDVELRSLKAEVEASAELMGRIAQLASLSSEIQLCDAALSDLLEHIDSYPAPPLGVLSTSHQTPLNASPKEQLSARLAFTRDAIASMSSKFATVTDDPRAIAERARILQTWSELEEMGNDRLGGKKSRPASVVSSRTSSGRNSSASVVTTQKKNSYSHLSVASASSRGRFLVPSQPNPRRAISGSVETTKSRPDSRISSLSSNRSTSGPLGLSLYGSTFASRQRTTSLSNPTSTPTRRPSATPLRSQAQTGQKKRNVSPTVSEASSLSHSVAARSRSSTSMSTWSRAPRNSLSSIMPRGSTPKKKAMVPRKTYVADPKNKLDVAVGDVVNKLPVGINVEGISETWKDQSGKYWIGNQDPKLCFCRILRSQTVMVRVGGGWTELSKFIQDHFAESFRLMPESPPRLGAPEEKWISSATLLEAPELETPPVPPRTPELTIPFVPSFSLSTPTGHSPRSIMSSPSTKGSPLTPLQFIRRADPEVLRPVTPSKSQTLRSRNTVTHTPARNSIWRP